MEWTDKPLISEDDLRAVSSGTTIRVSAEALVTPLAQDLIRERQITLIRIQPSPPPVSSSRRIAVGADHGGFEMKDQLKGLLLGLGHDVFDFGTASADPVDYPDYAHRVAMAVARGNCDLGIMIDGAGIGSCMVSNKVPGIRAAMCYDEITARNSREHNDANVLTLGAKLITIDQMRSIVAAWLSTSLSEERHRRRVAKIGEIEKNPFG